MPDTMKTTELSFAQALFFLLEGKKVGRTGWNGRKLGKVAFIVHQKGYPEGIAINKNTAESLGIAEGTNCIFEPYLMLAVHAGETPTYKCRPWTPDQRDQLATDWEVIA